MSQINYSPADYEEHVGAKNGFAEAAGETLIYLNALNIRNMFVEVVFTYGGDLDTVLDIVEADDVLGTNVQPITKLFPTWHNVDTDLSHAWGDTVLASSVTIDTTDGKNQKVCIQIDPMKLTSDLTDGTITTKKALALRIGVSDALNVISVVYRCLTRNQGAVDLRL